VTITRQTKREELAAIVCAHLEAAGIDVVLVGGSVAALYSDEKYVTYDLDLVTWKPIAQTKLALAELGFVLNGRIASHAESDFVLDMVSSTVMIGHKYISDDLLVTRETSYGSFKLLSALDCALDRLAAFYHYDDRQGLEQAVMVTHLQRVSLGDIEGWSKEEGRRQSTGPGAFRAKFDEFRRAVESRAASR
jgi:hypothetical protein